jgi:hypothetical protein
MGHRDNVIAVVLERSHNVMAQLSVGSNHGDPHERLLSVNAPTPHAHV